jgi:hypothetical protein
VGVLQLVDHLVELLLSCAQLSGLPMKQGREFVRPRTNWLPALGSPCLSCEKLSVESAVTVARRGQAPLYFSRLSGEGLFRLRLSDTQFACCCGLSARTRIANSGSLHRRKFGRSLAQGLACPVHMDTRTLDSSLPLPDGPQALARRCSESPGTPWSYLIDLPWRPLHTGGGPIGGFLSVSIALRGAALAPCATELAPERLLVTGLLPSSPLD